MRVNNQITLGLQNCPSGNPVVYQSLECLRSGYSSDTLKRFSDVQSRIEAKREPKYDFFGNLIVKRREPKKTFGYDLSPKLDLIRKFQRNVGRARSVLFGALLAKKVVLCLEHFGQYRLNKSRQFNNVAGQRIREAGAAMEIACNRQVRFCHCTTLTLPANHYAAYECLAAYSNEIVNRLFQVIRRGYKDINAYFYVWEFQKRGALHLHIAHYHPDECEGMLIGNLLIEQWHKLLVEISENSGVDMFLAKKGDRCTVRRYHQHHTQPMNKSVAGYFSKYAGKASESPENDYVRHHSIRLSPKRFWGSSFYLKRIVKENSFSLYVEFPNEREAENAYQEIVSAILEKTIIKFNRFEFEKFIEKIERYGFKGKAVFRKMRTKIAEGFREVFYVSPDDYQELLRSDWSVNPTF